MILSMSRIDINDNRCLIKRFEYFFVTLFVFHNYETIDIHTNFQRLFDNKIFHFYDCIITFTKSIIDKFRK